MNLIFGLEHTENRNGVLFESWFNGWPLPSDEKFQRIVEDNARYNSDLFGQGCDEEGMRAWLKFYPCPVAGFLPENHLLKYTTKNINDILPEEKYIYPILLHGGGMLNYTSFQEYGFTISERVLNDCRAGKCKILLHELNEGHGFNLGELKKFIENQLTKLNIPASSFGFLDGNYKTPELQRQYGTKGFCVFHWENHSRMLSYDEEVKRIQEIKNLKFKPYHFISLNRRPRAHRIPLVMHIMDKWADKTLYSCDTFPINSMECFDNPEMSSNTPLDYLIRDGLLTKERYLRLPILLDVPMTVNDTMVNTKLMSLAYVNITTETMFFEQTTQFFSEKVFKPFIYMQPFILVGSHNSLKLLREMGYKTFHPFINEDYDSIENPHERFQAIINEIDRLSKFTHEEMQKLVRDVLDILLHNLINVQTRRESFIKEQQFLKQLNFWSNNEI